MSHAPVELGEVECVAPAADDLVDWSRSGRTSVVRV